MKSFFSIFWLISIALAFQPPMFSKQAALPDEFADPCLIQEPNGVYWAFAGSNLAANVPIAQSLDFTEWQLLANDALPDAGSWAAADPAVQEPDVNLLDSGRYIMYYSAALAQNTSIHCIGAATSDNIQGPYTPNAEPFLCPQDDGGASGPSAFQDPVDDSLYVLFKIDGNNLLAGGPCGNDSPTQAARSTPILIQQVDALDGQTCIGEPSIILERGPDEDCTIGSPSLTAAENEDARNGYAYFLFYSSGCYKTVEYATRYATNINGPAAGLYNKAATALMRSGDGKNLHSPASLDISGDAEHVVFSSYEHAWVHGRRQLHTGLVEINGLIAMI